MVDCSEVNKSQVKVMCTCGSWENMSRDTTVAKRRGKTVVRRGRTAARMRGRDAVRHWGFGGEVELPHACGIIPSCNFSIFIFLFLFPSNFIRWLHLCWIYHPIFIILSGSWTFWAYFSNMPNNLLRLQYPLNESIVHSVKASRFQKCQKTECQPIICYVFSLCSILH